MATYRIKGETLENMADKIRILNGVEGAMTPAQMNGNLGEANADVSTEADLIAQISSALEGKASDNGSDTKVASITVDANNDSIFHYVGADGLNTVSDTLTTVNIVVPSICYARAAISDFNGGKPSLAGGVQTIFSTATYAVLYVTGPANIGVAGAPGGGE
jgi:hypothetical protein